MVRRPKRDVFYSRTAFLTVFLLLLFAAVVFRLFILQVVRGENARKLAEQQHSIYRKLSPSRGEIKLIDKVTSQSFPLATNIDKYLVYAVPHEITNAKTTAEALSKVLNLDESELLGKLTQQERKYVPLKKQLSDQEQQAIKNLELPGIYFDDETVRVYPEQNLLSQVLGFVGFKSDRKEGLYGLERYFEKNLVGTPGTLIEEKDTAGAWIFGSKREIVPAVDGVNLILTVDKTIQFQAENILKETVKQNEADSGTVIVANPKTGAILAMANYPDFNPNEYNKVENPTVFLNQAVTGNYEPGSVFKPITMAAAIDEGKVTPDTTYNDTGEVKIDDHVIKNADNEAHGFQTMTQVLEKSLNTGIIFAKDQIGDEEFYKRIKAFGFGEETGIELPETKGNLDNLKAKIKVNFHTASFGQGISVTPLQLVQAFTAIANQGKMMKPFIVQSKIYPNGRVENTEPQVARQVISPKTANTVAAMMVSVVESGHGKRAAVSGYYIAGKTGTAQVPKKDGRGYEKDNNIGSFIGFGPVDNPQFLILVRINHPRTVSFAETTAAPAFGKLAQFVLNYFHIPPSRQ